MPNDLVLFSGQALKIRECPKKFGTDVRYTLCTVDCIGLDVVDAVFTINLFSVKIHGE